jgi:hypothetical protein
MKPPRAQIQESLERRILHGLACEWENALWILPADLRRRMHRPHFRLADMKRLLGSWCRSRREISLSRELVLESPWDSVVEVLLHETAHQLAEEILGSAGQSAHGPAFREACRLLRANPKASGRYPSLHDRITGGQATPQCRILDRVKKLMALAESANRFEAEAAMAKAHDLVARYNLDLIARNERRDYVSLFVGRPALRHFRDAYHLANILQEFYYVAGLWVPAYVLERSKMGRVFEITGTARNVETAGYVHDFVKRYISAAWRVHNPKGRRNRHGRTDFAMGVIEGFRDKLVDQRRRRQAGPVGHGDLVRVEDPALCAYIAYRYPHTTRISRKAARHDAVLYGAGKRMGRELVISRGITEKKKEPLLRIGEAG